jgi:hypothetical protein
MPFAQTFTNRQIDMSERANENEIERWVDELMAAGCMPKVAARVVTAVFAAGLQSAPKDKAAEKRRAWDRERKAQQKKEKQINSTGIHPNPVEREPVQILWADGPGLLVQMGLKDRLARDNIGRWLKAGNDPARIFHLIRDAHGRGIGNPIPWITAALGTQNGKLGKRNLAELAFDLADEARELERKAGVQRPAESVRRDRAGGPDD